MQKKPSHDCKKNRLDACPECAQQKLRLLEPGDRLELGPGEYDEPLTLIGLRGVEGKEIMIRGQTPVDEWWVDKGEQRLPRAKKHAVVTSGITAENYRQTANRAAALKQAAGEFPGLYYIADEACFYLRDCQHVVVENLYFDNCWPTAIYLDNCQDIAIRACQFRWGTFAIGAAGAYTRHLLIEDCRWQQNPDNVGHWKTIPWHRIHGDPSNYDIEPDKGVVNPDEDYRHFDGDFFSGWQIAGFVTFRRNLIEDAFNGIHLFNVQNNVSTRLNINVVIESNRFERIRDNAIEPEHAAWNWVIRQNILVDVYSWFSFDMERSGWFYIYSNIGWYTQEPGPGNHPPKGIDPDDRTGGSIFKLPKRHEADGPTYMFHNSFHLRERIAKKKRLAGLQFFNNAITFCQEPDGGCGVHETLFANSSAELAVPYHPGDEEADILAGEKTRFTKHWEALGIAFYSNIIKGPDKIKDLVMLGYPFGVNSRDEPPGFEGPFTADNTTTKSFYLDENSDNLCRATAAEFEIKTRGIQVIRVVAGKNIGAFQVQGELFALPEEFKWIPSR